MEENSDQEREVQGQDDAQESQISCRIERDRRMNVSLCDRRWECMAGYQLNTDF